MRITVGSKIESCRGLIVTVTGIEREKDELTIKFPFSEHTETWKGLGKLEEVYGVLGDYSVPQGKPTLWVARDDDGELFGFSERPYKEGGKYLGLGGSCIKIDGNDKRFKDIQEPVKLVIG